VKLELEFELKKAPLKSEDSRGAVAFLRIHKSII
jgi:hypothetical protein